MQYKSVHSALDNAIANYASKRKKNGKKMHYQAEQSKKIWINPDFASKTHTHTEREP